MLCHKMQMRLKSKGLDSITIGAWSDVKPLLLSVTGFYNITLKFSE